MSGRRYQRKSRRLPDLPTPPPAVVLEAGVREGEMPLPEAQKALEEAGREGALERATLLARKGVRLIQRSERMPLGKGREKVAARGRDAITQAQRIGVTMLGVEPDDLPRWAASLVYGEQAAQDAQELFTSEEERRAREFEEARDARRAGERDLAGPVFSLPER